MKNKERIEYIHDLNTFQCCDNEVYLRGIDNKGEDILIVIPADELLTWIDMGYIRKQVVKHYSEINVEHPDDIAMTEIDKQVEKVLSEPIEIIKERQKKEEAENLKSTQNK